MTHRPLILYEDAAARALEPFALVRPFTEMRAGVPLVRERWERLLQGPVDGRIGAPHLAAFDESGTPPHVVELIAAQTIVANARFLPSLDATVGDADAWRADGRIVAVRLRAPLDPRALADGSATLETLLPTDASIAPMHGWWVDHAWDPIRHLTAMLGPDINHLGPTLAVRDAHALGGVHVLGTHAVYIEDGATIEPLVVLDATQGPVLVRRGAHIQSFSRLVGPCAIGADSVVHGDRVAASSIGDQCRVRGEVSVSIFVGQANKAHLGFVGHSIVGRWANLGAGTTTSNLKNSYGAVSLWTPAGARNTGMQFVGSLIGDHAKLAINTRLMTGSVIGAGANVFDVLDGHTVVAPFAWGGVGDEVFALDKFIDVAERVLARRGAPLSPGVRGALRAAHANRWTP